LCGYPFHRKINIDDEDKCYLGSEFRVFVKGYFVQAYPMRIDEDVKELYFVVSCYSMEMDEWFGTLCYTSDKKLFPLIRELYRKSNRSNKAINLHLSGKMTNIIRENKYVSAIRVERSSIPQKLFYKEK
jgi:hypothetical protein